VTGDAARLSVHFGERGRAGGAVLAERILAMFQDGGLKSAILLRGGEGFGEKHGIRTSGQLTLSEDLPMVAIATGSDSRIEEVGRGVRALLDEGLVTIEPVRTSGAWDSGRKPHQPGHGGDESGSASLTLWTARHDRIEGKPAHTWLVDALKGHGLSFGIALPGADGLARGVRRRARFFSANRPVPMIVVGIGDAGVVASAGREVSRLVPEVMIEAVDHVAPLSSSAVGQQSAELMRLSIYGGGSRRGTGMHRQGQIVRMFRARGAPGATAYFGLYGFQGEESPHGDSIATLRRRVPVMTEVVDTADRCRVWVDAVRDLAGEDLMVTLTPVRRLSRPDGPA